MLESGAMPSEDQKAKIKFDLANANLQSVSRAQALYLTTLIVYICVVWAKFLTGSSAEQLHFGWLELKMDAVWAVTPVVTMVLTLAVIGTLNATLSAYGAVQGAAVALLEDDFESLFEVDTHKNVIDYLVLLQILPWGKTRKPIDPGHRQTFWLRTHHLIFPILFLLSLGTSWWAIHESFSLTQHLSFFRVFDWICFWIQTLFSVRPMYRWFCRFAGAKESSDCYH